MDSVTTHVLDKLRLSN